MTLDSAISSLSYDNVTFETNVSHYTTIGSTYSGYSNYVTKDYLDSLFGLDNYVYKFNPDGTITWELKDKENKEKNMKLDFKIVNYRVHEDRVVIVTFEDDKGNRTETKAVCNEDDNFDLENGVTVCVYKYLLGEDTYKGIIKDAMRQVKAVDKAKEDKKAREELIERKRIKAARKKARRRERQRQERISEMQEAYFKAMVEHDSYMEKYLYDDAK